MGKNSDEKTPAPDAKRCEAGGGSCGAGQPLYMTNGLVYCEHHSEWPTSKEGKVEAAMREAQKAGD